MNQKPEGPVLGTRFSLGWIGVISAIFGALSFGGVLCLMFPAILTTPALRDVYPMAIMRGLIQVVLFISFVLGLISVTIGRRRNYGAVGVIFAAVATLLGGADVQVVEPVQKSPYLGFDWFLLNLFFLALVFVPLERFFARLPDQPVFRKGWREDFTYFLVTHLIIQVTVFVTMAPARMFFGWAVDPSFQADVASQPLVLQFAEALIVTDLVQYAVHFCFHRIPFLWRFHQVHHSSTLMDWLAGSRLHLVDVVVTRAISYVPIFLLGFSTTATYAYLTFVSFQAIFIHANVRFQFGPVRWILATPEFHHWHHSAEREAIDKNFAVSLSLIDIIFGTFYLPNRWPKEYGIAGDPVPEGFVSQLTYPFRKEKTN